MNEQGSSRRVLPGVLAAVAFAVTAAIFFQVWRTIDAKKLETVREETRVAADLGADGLEKFVAARTAVARVLRDLLESGRLVDRDSYVSSASAIFESFEGIVALNWVDADGVIRWVVPEAGNRAASGLDLSKHPVARSYLEEARLTGMLVTTPPLELAQGGRGIACYLPIDGPDGRSGWVNIVFRVTPLVENGLHPSVKEQFAVTIRDGELPVFLTPSGNDRPAKSLVAASRDVAVGSRTWTLTLTPRPAHLAAHTSARPEFFLLFGLLAAGGVALLAWLRARAVQRLVESEARYRTVVEDLPDLVCRFRPDTTITFVNEAYARYFGRTAEALIGTSFLDLIPPEKHDELRAHLATLDRGNPSSCVEHEVISASGSVRWQRWHDRALFDESGAVRELQSIGSDITDSKTAEQAVQASEQRYKVLLESVSEGIVTLDATATIREVNDRVCELTGASGGTLIGTPVGALLQDAGEGASHPVADVIREVLDTGEPRTTEASIRREDGRGLWVDVRLTLARIEGRRRVVAAIRDITSRKQLEEQLRQSQKLQAVGTFCAGVAHDFNNVLTAVLGFSDTARLFVEDREDAKLSLDGIRRACEQAAGLTRSLLTFSRGGSNEKAPVLLNQVVADTVELLHHMLPAAVSIRSGSRDDTPFWVHGDEAQIQQVVMNLAINARDAMIAGGELSIDLEEGASGEWEDSGFVTVSPDRGTISIVVSDTGTGMPEDVRTRAVEPFFSTKTRGQGTGLGLSVVHGIVHDHGGAMRIESIPGAGTTVRIVLPRCESPLPEQEIPELTGPATAAGETILVIEDNAQVRQIVTRALEQSGYDVLEADDGLEGVDVFERNAHRIRAAIVDVDLPRLKGLRCVEKMRASRPGLPVMLMSGLPDSRPRAHRPDGMLFIQKPFEVAALRRSLARLLAEEAVA